ncbi:hypothetical protein EMCRGX_G014281 [Ephydatia muelleri]
MQQSMQFQAAFLFFALSLRQDSNIGFIPIDIRQYSGSDYSVTNNSLNMQAREIPWTSLTGESKRKVLKLLPSKMKDNPLPSALRTTVVRYYVQAVLDRKRSETGVLLKRLDDVGQVDPQVALHSSGFVVVTLFDQDVQKCFTSCTGVHPSIAAWKQAQLSLSRGGLGLRSLSHHAPAAFIASLCFSGLASNSHVHLLQSLETFNSSVHQSDNIQIGSVLEKLPSQKTLSSILDDNLFRVLQGSLSIADRARLLSAFSPHVADGYSV